MSKWIMCAGLTVIVAVTAAALAGGQQASSPLTPEDHVEIQQLYFNYARAIDSGDAEGYAGMFTPDGRFGNSVEGREALIAFAKGYHEDNEGWNRHWNNGIRLTPTPEGAEGGCYLIVYNTSTRPPTIILTGIYRDTLVQTADGWRFKTRRVEVDRPADRGQ